MVSIKRIIFAIFNSIFFILGLAVLGVGVYVVVKDDHWIQILKGDDKSLIQAPTILIAAGVFVALIGFFGCVGAWKQNAKCLITYAILVFCVFLLEIAAGIYTLKQKGQVQKHLKAGVQRAIQMSYGKSDEHADKALKEAVDWFQKNLHCCGSKSPADWKKSVWYKNMKKPTIIVPSSCCVKETKGCNGGNSTKALGNKIFTKGCVEQGWNLAQKNMRMIVNVAVGVGVIQLLGIVCAILLCREIKSYDAL